MVFPKLNAHKKTLSNRTDGRVANVTFDMADLMESAGPRAWWHHWQEGRDLSHSSFDIDPQHASDFYYQPCLSSAKTSHLRLAAKGGGIVGATLVLHIGSSAQVASMIHPTPVAHALSWQTTVVQGSSSCYAAQNNDDRGTVELELGAVQQQHHLQQHYSASEPILIYNQQLHADQSANAIAGETSSSADGALTAGAAHIQSNCRPVRVSRAQKRACSFVQPGVLDTGLAPSPSQQEVQRCAWPSHTSCDSAAASAAAEKAEASSSIERQQTSGGNETLDREAIMTPATRHTKEARRSGPEAERIEDPIDADAAVGVWQG
ncbi:hypothetical protein Q7P35_012177 [Cladosporium inversicolor]